MESGAEHSTALHQDQRAEVDVQNTVVSESGEQPMPAFEPVFPLLTHNSTNTTIHPHVQYIFSDDDTTALDTASSDDPTHRSIIVDLEPNEKNDGWQVAWASSLSSDFAVTSATLAKPQQNAGDVDADGTNGTLMLRLEGATREPIESRFDPDSSQPSSGSASGAIGRDEVETLADDFRRRMGAMRTVVDAGQHRRAVAWQQQQQHGEFTSISATNETPLNTKEHAS